jgi:hypothetical protein
MKLLDLPDKPLAKIVQFLNKDSKLQLMTVCKRFEELIGNTPTLYKDFQLIIKDDKLTNPDICRALENIRRNVNMVVILIVDFSRSTSKFDVALKLFQKIGANLSRLCILEHSVLTNRQFLELLDQTRDLEELYLENIELKATNHQADLGDFKSLDRLVVLLTKNVKNHEIIHLIARNSLPGYTVGGDAFNLNNTPKYWKDKDSKTLCKILMKTEGMDILNMSGMTLSRFECSPKNCSIKQFSTNGLTFLERDAFLNFKNFMLMQKCVTEYGLFIAESDCSTDLSTMPELNRHDYTEILGHVLNLKSLKDFSFVFSNSTTKMLNLFKTAKICNPSVEILKICDIPVGLDFGIFARSFPNVNSLKIKHHWAEHQFGSTDGLEYMLYDIKSLKSMENVEKLKFNFANEFMIGQIELKGLRELIITEYYTDSYRIYYEFEGSRAPILAGNRTDLIDIETFDVEYYAHTVKWMNFVKKNQQLESFHIIKTALKLTCVHLEILLTKLPNLKSLEVQRIQIYEIAMERIADVIGRNYDRLDHFKVEIISYHRVEFDRFETRLQQLYPNVKYQRDGSLITISK